MKLRNTSGFSDGFLREVLRFVTPNGVGRLEVRIENRTRGCYSGHSYQGSRIVAQLRSEDTFFARARRRVILQNQRTKAASRGGSKGYLDFATFSPEEDAVLVLAHEMRHQWQGLGAPFWKVVRHTYAGYGEPITVERSSLENRPRRGMVWGSRGQYSERDADAYAVRMVRAWRRTHRPEPVLRPELFEVDTRSRVRLELCDSEGYPTGKSVELVEDGHGGWLQSVGPLSPEEFQGDA